MKQLTDALWDPEWIQEWRENWAPRWEGWGGRDRDREREIHTEKMTLLQLSNSCCYILKSVSKVSGIASIVSFYEACLICFLCIPKGPALVSILQVMCPQLRVVTGLRALARKRQRQCSCVWPWALYLFGPHHTTSLHFYRRIRKVHNHCMWYDR